MSCKKNIRILISWSITIAIFIIIFSRIEFGEVIKIFKQVDITLLSITIGISLLANIFFYPVRYKKILGMLGCRLSLFETILLKLGSNPIKIILPMRIGELTRVVYLKKMHGLSYFKGISSILLGILLNFFILFLFMFAGLFFYNPYIFQKTCFILLFFILFLLTVSFIRKGIISSIFKKMLKKFHYENSVVFLEEYSWKTIMVLFFYSLVLVICLLINTFLILKAFNIEIPFGVFLLFAPLTIFAAILPITICGLGTRESAMLLLFSKYASLEKLLGSSLFISAINILLPVFIGLFFMKPFLNKLLASEKKTCLSAKLNGG